MGPNRYRYCKGGNGKQESVELDVYNKGEYHTTCVINVCFLLIGCKWFPCSNGYEHAITSEETIKILELIQKERRNSRTVKRSRQWTAGAEVGSRNLEITAFRGMRFRRIL